MQSSRKWCKAFVSRHKRSQTDLKENHNIAELVQKFLCPVFQWLLSCVSPRASEWLFAPLNVGEPSLHARRSKSAGMGLVGKKERCPVNKNKHRCRNIIQRIKCCGLVLISYKSRTGSSDVSGAVCPALSSRTCLRVCLSSSREGSCTYWFFKCRGDGLWIDSLVGAEHSLPHCTESAAFTQRHTRALQQEAGCENITSVTLCECVSAGLCVCEREYIT